MKYLLDVSDLSGTVAEKKIGDLKAGKKVDSTQNKAKFTQEQTDAMKNDMAHLLYYFGYTNHSSKSNPQEFFKFDQHEAKHLEDFEKFKAHNATMIVNEARVAGDKYKINSGEGVFDLVSDRIKV